MAQFGRALRSGRRGRGFESRRFDWNENAESLDNQELRHFFVCQKENRKQYTRRKFFVKALFFDIDGTLLSEITKEIPQSALDALKKTAEKGNLTFY